MTRIKEFSNLVLTEVASQIEKLDESRFEKAAELILRAEAQGNRVHVTGIGKPGHVAGYVASLLSSTGTPAYFLDGTEAIHGSAGQVLSGDVVIAISNSGETEELKKTITTLKNNGSLIIAVSGNDNSWLAKSGEVALLAHVDQEGDAMNKPPRASILSELVVLQGLSLLLQEHKGITPAEYVKWHPGGSLGKSIREEN